ncbi:MAG TPA: hypothetical protein DCY13_21510, partial [Verrucomicrobiales bacterium]|nr:hypothetical protein [Verrucomicrobiales bacterium]
MDAFAEAVSRLDSFALPKVTAILSSLDQLVFEEGVMFDTVVICEVIEHIYPGEEEQFLRRLRGHVHGGTRFIVSTPIGWMNDPHHTRGFTESEFMRHLEHHYGPVRKLDYTAGYSQVAVGTFQTGDASRHPRVSVVLPTFNHLALLPQSIASILAQTFEDFELVIVNDGSTDGTREYLDSLNDPRIRVIHQNNRRLPAALNAGFAIARGELLTWTSADNYCAPVFLEALVGALDANPHAGLAVGAFASIDEQGRITRLHEAPNMSMRKLLQANPGVAAFLYRREVQEAVGPYATDLEGAEDWDMWIRIVERYSTVQVPELLYYYRRHADSMTARKAEQIQQSCVETFRRALARRDGQLDLAQLYPQLGNCGDRAKAEVTALFDFGTLLLKSPAAAPELAVQFLNEAFGRDQRFEILANLTVALARCGRWQEVDECLLHLRAKRHGRVKEIVTAIEGSRAGGALPVASDMPIFYPDQTEELLASEAADLTEYSITLQAPSGTTTPAGSETSSNPASAGNSTGEASRLDQIEAQAREALALEPNGIAALKLLAGVALRQERWEEAAQWARRLFELQRDDVETLLMLAKCFFQTGDIDSTRIMLRRVLELDPNNELARQNLADLEAAQRASAGNVERVAELIRTAQEAIAAGDPATAIPLLEEAIKGQPDDAELMVATAGLHTATGSIDGARRLLSRALIVDPAHAAARDLLVDLTLNGDGTSTAAAPAKSAPAAAATSLAWSGATPNQATVDYEPRTLPGDAKDNEAAFAHLQRGFDLLKQRQFAEAQAACRRYQGLIDYDALQRTDNRSEANPLASVIIVAYRINEGLIQCLDSLAASVNPPHEIIVVDNGGNESIHAELAKRDLLHIRVGFNVILAEGRNIGVHFARSNYAVFIDDDAIAAPGYIAAAIEGFTSFDVHAFRGKVLPKSDHPHNSRARHYNLGDLPFPADIDTEGNSAFRIDTWRKLGGQDPLLFGGEGVDLSYRIGRVHGDFVLMYWPFMVIQHDYAVTDTKLETKSSRHVLMREYSVFKHPDLYTFHNRLVAFARNSETKAEGGRLLIRRSRKEEAPRQPVTQGSTGQGIFFSICVPTYNRARFLTEALNSALNQTWPNFEIVVVDDGSTDDTAAVMKRCNDPRVRYVLKEHSGGPATRNRCVKEARGEFLVWLDSDDALLPGTLERYAQELARHPEVDVLYGHLQVADENLRVGDRWLYRDYHGWPAALLADTLVENRIPNVCTLVRKVCYERFGGYNPAFPRAHDYEFWSRLAGAARFKSVGEDVGIYRRHEQSLSKVNKKVDTSHEARLVRAMLEQHPLAAVLPGCYAAGAPRAHGDARAWALASLI